MFSKVGRFSNLNQILGEIYARNKNQKLPVTYESIFYILKDKIRAKNYNFIVILLKII